jgi:hypothetical protein
MSAVAGEKMRIRTVAWTLDFLWIFGALALGFFAATISHYIIIPILGLFLLVGILNRKLRCPRCGRNVFRKRWHGFKIHRTISPGDEYISPSMAKQCFDCGNDLTRAPFDWKMLSRKWTPSNAAVD